MMDWESITIDVMRFLIENRHLAIAADVEEESFDLVFSGNAVEQTAAHLKRLVGTQLVNLRDSGVLVDITDPKTDAHVGYGLSKEVSDKDVVALLGAVLIQHQK